MHLPCYCSTIMFLSRGILARRPQKGGVSLPSAKMEPHKGTLTTTRRLNFRQSTLQSGPRYFDNTLSQHPFIFRRERNHSRLLDCNGHLAGVGCLADARCWQNVMHNQEAASRPKITLALRKTRLERNQLRHRVKRIEATNNMQ